MLTFSIVLVFAKNLFFRIFSIPSSVFVPPPPFFRPEAERLRVRFFDGKETGLQNLKIFPTLFDFARHFFSSKRNGKIFQFWNANFFKVCGRKRSEDAKLKIGIRIFRKKSSDFVQKAPQFFKIKVFGIGSLGASRRKVEIVHDFPSVFEIKIQSLLGQCGSSFERSSKSRKAGQTNLFLSPFG